MGHFSKMKGKEIVVLGGGISGLATSYFLRELNPSISKITILEANGRMGGWIETATLQDTYLMENGARGFRPAFNGAETLNLIEKLGLTSEMITSSTLAKERFILYKGQLQALPSSKLDALKFPLLMSCIHAYIKDRFTGPCQVRNIKPVNEYF